MHQKGYILIIILSKSKFILNLTIVAANTIYPNYNILDNPLNGAKSPLSLEISLKLERGLNGKWEIKHSSVKDVDWVCNSGLGPTQAAARPISSAKIMPSNPPQARVFKPKHAMVWQPKRKLVSSRPLQMRETVPPTTSSAHPRPCERPIQPSPCPPLSPSRSPMFIFSTLTSPILIFSSPLGAMKPIMRYRRHHLSRRT